jgi:hypothetical protein
MRYSASCFTFSSLTRGIKLIDEAAPPEARVDCHAEQAASGCPTRDGDSSHRSGVDSASSKQSYSPDALGDEGASVGQERHVPRSLEAGGDDFGPRLAVGPHRNPLSVGKGPCGALGAAMGASLVGVVVSAALMVTLLGSLSRTHAHLREAHGLPSHGTLRLEAVWSSAAASRPCSP